MKKVVIVNTFGYPLFFNTINDSQIGGTEVQLFYLAESLKKDFDITLIVSDFGQPNKVLKGSLTFIKGFSLKKNLWNYLLGPILFLRALHKARGEVYITSPAGWEMYLTALYCLLLGKKHIHRVAHDDELNDDYFQRNFLQKLLRNVSFLLADKVIAQTIFQQNELFKKFKKESFVIKNGFPSRGYFFEEKEKIVLWVARCIPWKQPEVFLRIATKLPEYKFIMVAPGEGEYFESIKKEAENISNLIFYKHYPFHKIQALFDKAMVFVSTSKYEGFPNTFLQASLAGTPIASLHVDPDHFLSKQNKSLVANGDEDMVAFTIKKLLEERVFWEKQSKYLIGYVKENNDLKYTISQWGEILNGV